MEELTYNEKRLMVALNTVSEVEPEMMVPGPLTTDHE